MTRDRALNLLKIMVSVSLIAFLLSKIGLADTFATFKKANLYYLVAAFALFLLGVPVRAYRWQTLLVAHEMNVSLRKLTSLYLVGFFFNNVLPTAIGGDVVKMYELSKYSRQTAPAVTTVLADRLAGYLVLLAMAQLALLFSYQLVDYSIIALLVAFFLGSLIVAGLLVSRGLWQRLAPRSGFIEKLVGGERARGMYEAAQVYSNHKVTMLKTLAASAVWNFMLIAINYLTALALGVRISLWYFLLFVPIISSLLLLPISLSGLGVREGGYVFLFTQVGVAAPVALSISLSIYAMTVATGLIGGMVYVAEGARGYLTGSKR